MRKARVLVVDDSTVIRRLLGDALSHDPAIEVVGTAPNGKIGLAKISQVNPDLITLDIEMPEMDGLETLKELRKVYPKLPVIMFSTLTQRGAVATLQALSFGASDYVTKPANVGSVTAAISMVQNQLIPKIKALCPWTSSSSTAATATGSTADFTHKLSRCKPATSADQRVEIIAIGVSTGGPNALTAVFKELPATLPVPVVVVQHMPAVFTKYLSDRLNAASGLQVREATNGELLRPGGAWIAPGDYHMALVRTSDGVSVRLHQGPPENSCRPAVDVLFRSVAELYGKHALAAVLTGMGQDGLRGCETIHQCGGTILAQDEPSSVVWGMPGAVVRARLADEVLPLSEIASTLIRRTEGKSLSLPTLVGT